MSREPARNFDQQLLNLYEDYAHGLVDRREFMRRASTFAVGGVTVEALLSRLSPNYALAQQVAADDPRIRVERIEYASPKGGGTIAGLLVTPRSLSEKIPSVLVVHENRGLNPHIEDVARRFAAAGFLTLAPDALSPLGGYPGNDDEGRALQSKRSAEEMIQDFMAGAQFLAAHPQSNGKVGAVGFCFGGGVTNDLACRLPEIVKAAAPFYGRQPDLALVSQIKGALLIHYAELDTRINAGWPAYEQALQDARVQYEAHIYPGVNHAFFNDTTPRYDSEAAKLAWQRTVQFFQTKLK
ncbi:MAG: dienelactone hydrolase family protein [Pirellulaceae bacterium]|nr:dienelactone hydrolase family protein [Pirellulaceae bacterium]